MRIDWGQRGRLTRLESQDSSVQGLCSDHPSITSAPHPVIAGLPSHVWSPSLIRTPWIHLLTLSQPLPPRPLRPHTPTPPPSHARFHIPSLQSPHTCDGVSRAAKLVAKLCVIKNLQLSPQPVIFIRVGILTTFGLHQRLSHKKGVLSEYLLHLLPWTMGVRVGQCGAEGGDL